MRKAIRGMLPLPKFPILLEPVVLLAGDLDPLARLLSHPITEGNQLVSRVETVALLSKLTVEVSRQFQRVEFPMGLEALVLGAPHRLTVELQTIQAAQWFRLAEVQRALVDLRHLQRAEWWEVVDKSETIFDVHLALILGWLVSLGSMSGLVTIP